MACVDFDVDEYLYEASENALREEIKERIGAGRWKGDVPSLEKHVHPWSVLGIADDLRTAFYARNAARFEAVLAVLENKEELPKVRLAA